KFLLPERILFNYIAKKFGFKKAMKCKSIPFGMKSAVERGLYAVFHTFSRKTSSSTINISDEAGYAIFHHAALHNRVPIICQLCNANFNVNQRRFIILNQEKLGFIGRHEYGGDDIKAVMGAGPAICLQGHK
ncbi:hypothetical protein JEQ12_014269, partial [Ovis aries]